MKTVFTDLISGQNFERKLDHYFGDLSSSKVNYIYLFSTPCNDPDDDPCLRIDFDNLNRFSRLTLWESGKCHIESMTFKNSTKTMNEESELSSLEEFEDKLFSLIAHMKDSHQLH